MDKILVSDLTVDCTIGVRSKERRHKQTVIICVSLACNLARACKTDDLTDTLDYSVLVQSITKTVESSRFHLLEALAECIADVCLGNAVVSEVTVSVAKSGAISSAKYALVEITRSKL